MRPWIGAGSGGNLAGNGVIEAEGAGLDVVRMNPLSRLDVGRGKADRLPVFADRRSARDSRQRDLVPHLDPFAGDHGRSASGDVDRGSRRNSSRRDANVVIRMETQKAGTATAVDME